MSENQENARKV